MSTTDGRVVPYWGTQKEPLPPTGKNNQSVKKTNYTETVILTMYKTYCEDLIWGNVFTLDYCVFRREQFTVTNEIQRIIFLVRTTTWPRKRGTSSWVFVHSRGSLVDTNLVIDILRSYNTTLIVRLTGTLLVLTNNRPSLGNPLY